MRNGVCAVALKNLDQPAGGVIERLVPRDLAPLVAHQLELDEDVEVGGFRVGAELLLLLLRSSRKSPPARNWCVFHGCTQL